MSENSDASNESNRLCGGNPILRAGVLRPSVLGSTINPTKNDSAASTLFDGKVKETSFNPFLKAAPKEADAEDSEAIASSTTSADKLDEQESKKADQDNDDEIDERPDPMSLLRKNGMERANLFAAAKSSMPRVENSGFVFGQNVHERVVGETVKPDSSSKTEKADSTSGELLFSSVIQNATKSNENEERNDSNAAASSSSTTAGGVATQDNEVKSLTEVAREYEESRAQKRKFEEVETFTGEENEANISDISCKLFAFVNSNWEERGRGSLRLNDSKTEQGCSRVVFRTSGNLRLLLNTKVWAGMVAERPSQKSLRLTAMDNTGKIKVFLAQARPVEINQLHKALVQRIDLRKASHPEEGIAVEKNGDENGDNATKNGAETTNNLSTTAENKIDLDNSKSDDNDDDIDDDDDVDDENAAEPSPKKPVNALETSST